MKLGQKRLVHTSIWASGQFSKLSQGARLTYIGTITLGDDDGRFKGAPSLIRSELYRYDDDIKVADVTKWLKEIIDQKLLVKYEIEGEDYLYHPKWESYQHIREDRRRDSNIPAPVFDFSPVTTKRQPTARHLVDKTPLNTIQDNIIKDKLIDTSAKDQAFASFWGMYPKKVGKKAAWKAWQKVGYTTELGLIIAKSLQDARNSPGWQNDKGRYIPHASTWINGERWNDEIAPAKPKNTKYDNVNSKTVRS